MKEHHLQVVGYYEMRPMPGDPPWGNIHKVNIYGCTDCMEIHNYKPKRGYRTIITNGDFVLEQSINSKE